MPINKKINKELILTEWLVLNAQSGDAEALEQLVKIWYPKLLRYASYQLEDTEEAQDSVQESLLVMTRKLKGLKDPRSFPKWIYQILHRKGIDYLRKKIRKRERIDERVEVDDQHDASKDNSTVDTHIDVVTALQKLDKTSALLVHLHYLEGLSIKEVAKIIKIPIGTVKSRLHKCRKQLKAMLDA